MTVKFPMDRPPLVAVPPIDKILSDDELMLAARSGERICFDDLIRRHQRKVFGYARKFFNNPALAADVAQDVFVDLLKALPRYRPEGHFSTFLYKITLNRCRMAARSRRYEDGLQNSLGYTSQLFAKDEILERDRDRAIQNGLLQLTEKQREVLLLRFWSGLKHEEIAEVLSTRVGTVKSRLFGALAALKKVLGDEHGIN